MIQTDVLIVGGGPAGSACAWRLKQDNISCLILDRSDFPRRKPCAGWITPQVVRDLELNPASYPYSFTTYSSFQISIGGITFKLPSHQHAIRRYEFDEWLLRRADVPFQVHTVKTITRQAGGYELDGEYSCKYLVGAGGTHCPVYQSLFQTDTSRPKESLVVALEEEFPYDYKDRRVWLWFLENHLPGYAWYVPKANGYVNVGIGGMAEKLKARDDTLKNHWNRLLEKLDRMGLVRGHSYKPNGHSYFTHQNRQEISRDNAFLVGDSAGLATHDMGEGIGPAIKSGLLAAEAILHHTPYSAASIPRYSNLFTAWLTRP
jgi:geranylgeranyl reductase family protein